VISVWEVALKVSQRKLDLQEGANIYTWFADAREEPGISLEPITSEDAIEAWNLPGQFHKDPADRLIVALARRLNCELVTVDERIVAYPHVRSIS
jgi:PIN domain nuclease of toxin-antitoxin system